LNIVKLNAAANSPSEKQYTSNTLQDTFFATLLSVFGDYTV